MTPTYAEYVLHAHSRGFQPISKAAFYALIAVGFNPITNEWVKQL